MVFSKIVIKSLNSGNGVIDNESVNDMMSILIIVIMPGEPVVIFFEAVV